MCGIGGCRLGSAQPSPDQMWAVTEALRHRGPDDSGILTHGEVGLAHTRLSLLDLTGAGHQPMIHGDWALVFNGEIYNFQEERNVLEREGETFLTSTDTEVLLRSLVLRGIPKTLERIRGMFAFALCHLPSGVIHLARDRFGIKPLLYMEREGALWFSSEVKGLMTMSPIEVDSIVAAFSISGMADHSPTYTPFKDVLQIPPGCWGTSRPGKPIQINRYYNLDDVFSRDKYVELDRLSFNEVVDRFEGLLKDAVEATLISDGPLGVFLSGGIDSSVITSLASTRREQLQLFTSDVRGRYSEVADARLVCRHVKRPLCEAAFLPDDMLHRWVKSTWHYECPIVTHTNAIPFGSVAELARTSKVKAVLTGEGADELFLGYSKLAAERYRTILVKPARALEGAYGVIPGLREYVFPDPSATAEAFLGILSQRFERQHQRAASLERYSFLPRRTRMLQYQTVQMLREHLLSLLHRNDRMGMLASIESRFPFLDERLVEFAVNLPVAKKIRVSTRLHNRKHPFLSDKAVVRALARRLLPEKIAHKQKNGFPMYGHRDMRVSPKAFQNSYVADLFGLSRAAGEYMHEHTDPYMIAKLASVEIFGRLFALREKEDSIQSWVSENVRLRAE